MLKYADLLSPKVTLYYKGAKRYSNLFGLALSLIYILLIFGFGIYFFITFATGEEMSLIYGKDLKEKSITANLSKKLFGFQITDSSGKIVNSKVLETYPTFWTVSPDNWKVEILEEEICQNDSFDKKYENIIDFDVSSFKCLYSKNKSDILLTENNSPYISKYINIYVAKCKNSTKNENRCYTEEKINKILKSSNYYLNILTESISIDNDKKNPLIPHLHSEQISIPITYINSYHFVMRKINYESDDGILFDNKILYSDFGLDTLIKSYEMYSLDKKFFKEESLLIFQLSLDARYIDYYRRSYLKIQSFVANLGGLCSFFYFLGETLTMFFCRGYTILSLENDKVIRKPSFKKEILFKTKTTVENLKTFETPFSGQKKNHYGFCEIIFFRFCKNKQTYKYIRNLDKFFIKVLDIRNIINLSKMSNYMKFETTLNSTKNDFSKELKILGKMNQNLMIGSNLDLDNSCQVFKKAKTGNKVNYQKPLLIK